MGVTIIEPGFGVCIVDSQRDYSWGRNISGFQVGTWNLNRGEAELAEGKPVT